MRLQQSSRDIAQRLIGRLDGLLDAQDVLRLTQRAGIDLDPWQLRVLRSTASTMLLNCSRQAGKSTICALLIARELLTDNAMVLIVSPSERQSKELMRKVLAFWRQIGRPVKHVTIGRTHLELVNGSRIEAVPGSADTIVGFTPTLIVVDEAARVDDDLFDALSPMLAVSRGRMIAPSTPKGKRGWWYDLWRLHEDPDIERVEVPATECPRISPEFLARERRRVGETVYQQEYLCQFLDDERATFRSEDIEAAQVATLDTWEWCLSLEVGA